MMLNIEVDTFDKRLLNDIFSTTSIRSGDEVDIYKNVTLKFQITLKKFSIKEPDTIIFTLEITRDNSNIEIFSIWLYENLINRAVKLKINQKEVEISEGAIKKIFRTIIEKNLIKIL